jgi:hypothetical protein
VTVDPSSISRAIRARPIGVSTFALDVAPQRARAVDRVVSLGGDQLPGRGRELERYSAAGQAAAHVVDLEARDLLDLLLQCSACSQLGRGLMVRPQRGQCSRVGARDSEPS